jgi:DNA-binding MarR family transcriptional regulator
MPELDRVIHEPARLLIVTVLATVEEADFLYLLRATELTKGNLSAHLAKLEEAGYVQIEKAFRGKIPLTLARLTPEGLDAFRRYRKEMTALLKVRERRRSAARARSLTVATQKA